MRPDVRLALSNPSTEAASFEVYEKAVLSTFLDRPLRAAEVSAYLRSQAVLKSRLVHHRESPELLASGRADVAVLYHHLALRYVRIFPNLFEFHPLTETPRTEVAIARVGGGGRFGSRLVAFMRTDEIGGIYSRHGLSRASWG